MPKAFYVYIICMVLIMVAALGFLLMGHSDIADMIAIFGEMLVFGSFCVYVLARR